MSYSEYYDLYNKCQANAPYHLFVFDIVGSKNLSHQGDKKYISNICVLINNVYQKIKKIEQEEQRQILHHSNNLIQTELKESVDSDYYTLVPIKSNKVFYRADLQEPFQICGDTIGLTILRDSLTEEEVYKIFEETKKELDITYEFHYMNCFYETDNYSEGNNKLFRGYAIQMLSQDHINEKEKTKIKKK